MKASITVWTAFLLLGFRCAAGQSPLLLTDEQARKVATSLIHAERPEPCNSTYRNEGMESWVVDLQQNRIVGNQLNDSVYFYRVASDSCDYVAESGGKSVLLTQITIDCCEYGIVAVDRRTAKSYWFAGTKKEDLFKEFARDEHIHPDLPEPVLFISLYQILVCGGSWGRMSTNEIVSIEQLRDVVRENFRSAYSPGELDNVWERKFKRWWRRYRAQMPQLKLETTYEKTSEGAKVHGYAFNGFELTMPSTSLPPKGTPRLVQWTLLVRPDGTVERLPSVVIYESHYET